MNMPSSKLVQNLPLIQQNWNNFIQLIKQYLKELTTEQKKVDIEIKKIERISKILKVSENSDNRENDIIFYIEHKKSFTDIYLSLESNFLILEALKKRNNLDNDLAVQTYIQIKNSVDITKLSTKLEELMSQSDLLQEKINTLQDLIYGEDYSQIDLIKEMCEKHNIGEDARKMIFAYPIIKTLRKPTLAKKKTLEVKSDETTKIVSSATIHDDMEVLDEDVSSGITIPEIRVKEETKSYEEDYNQQKSKYDKIIESVKSLLTKYYNILNEMKPFETEMYKKYCSCQQEDLDKLVENQFGEKYNEAKAKILAIKVFFAKKETKKSVAKILAGNYTNKDDIDNLEKCIKKFQSLCDELTQKDQEIINDTKEGTTSVDSKVFFLTDGMHGSFIPEAMRKGVYQKSLMTIINAAEGGHISQKKGSIIQPLDVDDARYKEQIGRKVFCVRNNKIMVSYIKLNSNSKRSNDGGIIILTVAPLSSGGITAIQVETNKVIKGNREQLAIQIKQIEEQDEQQLKMQTIIRDELIQTKESFEEGEVNGYKHK